MCVFALLTPVSASGGLDQSWMAPGFAMTYAGAKVGSHGSPSEPANWLTFRAEVVAVGNDTVTFDLRGEDVGLSYSVTRSYDATTRKALDGPEYAFLWVNQEDVDAQAARFGTGWAQLARSDGRHHVFVAAGDTYYFDAATGLLSYMEDLETGNVAKRLPL